MGIISALVSVLKAMPVLERLVLAVADGVREAKAKARFEAKLDHIDAAIERSRPDWWERMPIGGTEERRDADQAPRVPQGRTGRT